MDRTRLLDEPRSKRRLTEEELPCEDGEKVETFWHWLQMVFLRETIARLYADWFVGANLFVYFDENQVKTRNFRGPDFFVVKGAVKKRKPRLSWVIWEEHKAPNVIIELSSPSTENEDLGPKKLIYQDVLKTPEYFLFHPSGKLLGFKLVNGLYQRITPDKTGRLISEELGLALRVWKGPYSDVAMSVWLRWETLDGVLLPTEREHEEQALHREQHALHREQRALQREEQQRRQAERFRALLKAHGIDPDIEKK